MLVSLVAFRLPDARSRRARQQPAGRQSYGADVHLPQTFVRNKAKLSCDAL